MNEYAEREHKRIDALPTEGRLKLDKLYGSKVVEYQFKKIKRSRKYPSVGDLFEMQLPSGDVFHGVVLVNHINNYLGEDLLLIAVLNPDVEVSDVVEISINDLFIPLQIVGSEYWSYGYFSFVKNVEIINRLNDYGFYNTLNDRYYDVYGEGLKKRPQYFGLFAVATIIGVSMKISREQIIRSFTGANYVE